MSLLLQLPRELRDSIYDYYLWCDGGYVYDPEYKQLLGADGSRVFLALALTCRQAASELRGRAFQVNTINFSATYSPSTSDTAANHHALADMIPDAKKHQLSNILPELFTPEIAQQVAEAYPRFAPLVDLWLRHGDMEGLVGDDNSFGESPSVCNDFIEYLLDLVSKHSDYCKTVKALPPGSGGVANLTTIIFPQSDPPYFSKTQHIYSAAAVALQFLSTCTHSTSMSVRKIILIEQEVSVAQPACHG